MATTFDVNRIGGGTFELVQDPTTGQYSLKKVGFDPVKSLTIPDYTAAATTAGTTDTAKAVTQTTAKTTAQQTTEVFKPTGGGDRIDYTGSMLKQSDLAKEAAKIDPQINARRLMTQDNAYTTQPGIMSEKETVSDAQKERQGALYPDAILRGGVGVKGESKRPGITVDKTSIRPFGAFDVTPKSQMEKAEYSTTRPAGIDTLGISRVEPTVGSFGTPAIQPGRDIEADPGTQPRADIEVEPTALKKVSTGLKSLAESVGKALTTGPIVSTLKSIAGASPAQKAENKFNRSYFNVRSDDSTGQRIAGNPATDLYAGMNRNSARGNLEKAGEKRIATREKTIAKRAAAGKPVSQKFIDDTNKMKDQSSRYKAEKQKATQGPAGGATTGGGGGGGGGGRVICTELHKTGELSTEDWVRDIKFTYSKLTKKHIKGYLSWAVPTVQHIKKYSIYRKVWKHIAQHRANDIAWRMKEGKFDLLGRIYAGIGEPLCWIIGNFVTDKNYNDIMAKGKRHI